MQRSYFGLSFPFADGTFRFLVNIDLPRANRRDALTPDQVMLPSQPKIVIVGAGPTGLGAAVRLQQLGHTNWILLEQSPEPGGLASSVIDENGTSFTSPFCPASYFRLFFIASD